jgi:hypothetical protein
VGVWPELEQLGEGDGGVPGVIDDDVRGGEDCVETETCAEAQDIVHVVSVHGGDDTLVVNV